MLISLVIMLAPWASLLGNGDGDRQSATIVLDPDMSFQTITAWEASSWMGQDYSPNFANYSDEVLDLVTGDLGINRLRVSFRSGSENPEDYWTQYNNGQINYSFWRAHRYATGNDNADPDVIDWSGFHFSELDYTMDKVVLPFKQRVEANGERLLINLLYVAFTAQNGPGTEYIHDDPDEYAEFALATFIHLDTNYSIVPDFVEVILEPDNVAQWDGYTIGNAMVATSAKLAAHGYHPKFIAPSNTNMGRAVTYFDQMAQVTGAVENLTELCYHRYGGVSDANLRAIAQRREQYGVDTSMLEHIGSGYQDLHKDLEIANCSSWEQFTIAGFGSDNGGAYYVIDETNPADPTVTIGRRTKFLRQYFKFVREGAVRIGATTTDGAYNPLAFINQDGSYVVVVKADAAGTFTIKGLPAGTFGIKYTTSSEYDIDLADVSIGPGEDVVTNIPAAGVLTLHTIRLTPTIDVDPDTAFQTITSWEATAWMGQDSNPNLANYSDEVLDLTAFDLGINRLRVEFRAGVENPEDYWTQYQTGVVDYTFWRSHRYTTINDNADPDVINWSGYHFSELDNTVEKVVLPFKQRVEAKGERLLINLNYVAFTSQNGAGTQYIHDDPDEYAELVLATYIHLDTNYSIVPDYLEVLLEPDNVAQWNGYTIGNAMVATAEKLAAHGYTPRFIAPSNTNMGRAVTYFDQMATIDGAIANLSELCYHRYGGVSDANLRAIAQRREQYGVDTSHLEHIGSGHEDLYKDLTIANCSSWAQYCLAGFGPGDGGGTYILIDQSNPADPTVSYGWRTKFLRQYFKFVRHGAVRVGVSSTSANLEPTAFINPDGNHVVVVKAAAAESFTVGGLPAGTYGIKYTTSSAYDIDLPMVTVSLGEHLATSIPAAGVLTVYSLNLTPSIDVFPRTPYVQMYENDTMNFTVTPKGADPSDLSFAWTLDGAVVLGWNETWYEYSTDFNSSGYHILNITIVDPRVPQLPASFQWYITVVNVNRLPVIGGYSPALELWVNETEAGFADFLVTASDPDGDPLTYQWSVDSSGVGTGTSYRFNYDYSSSGDYVIEVTVSDTMDGVSLMWLLHVWGVSRPPVVESYSPGQWMNVSEAKQATITFSVQATDPDLDPIAYSWSVNNVSVPGEASASYVFTYNYTSAGDYSIEVVLNDTYFEVTLVWFLHIEDVNRAPELISTVPQQELWVDEVEDGQVDFSVNAHDPDGDVLGYRWFVNGEEWPTATGPAVGFRYNFMAAGDYMVLVIVNDSLEEVSYLWHLHINNVNRVPVVTNTFPVDDVTINETSTVTLIVEVIDPDFDDVLTYRWVRNGTLILGEDKDSYYFAPGEPGIYGISVEARDDQGAIVTHQWTVTVEPVESPDDGDGDDREEIGPWWLALPIAIVLIFLIAAMLHSRKRW